jgi:hypothetical protein
LVPQSRQARPPDRRPRRRAACRRRLRRSIRRGSSRRRRRIRRRRRRCPARTPPPSRTGTPRPRIDPLRAADPAGRARGPALRPSVSPGRQAAP